MSRRYSSPPRRFGSILLSGVVLLLPLATFAAEPNAFLNLSSRGRVDRGENILIGGLVVEHRSNVLVRGVGPSLADKGVNDPVPHPRLTLYDNAGTALASNAGWRTGIPAWSDADGTQSYDPADGPADALLRVMQQTGAFDFTSDDDATLYVELPPGQFTVHLAADDDITGVGLLEVYLVKDDMDPFAPAWRVRQSPAANYAPIRQGLAPIAVVDETSSRTLRLAFTGAVQWNLPAGATPATFTASALELPWISSGIADLQHGRTGVRDSRDWLIAPRYTKTAADTAHVACLTTIGPQGATIREEATLTFTSPGTGTFTYEWGTDDPANDRIGLVSGQAQGTFRWLREPTDAATGTSPTASTFHRTFPKRYVDGRAAARWMIGSDDIGRVLLHGDGPDNSDTNGAREAIVYQVGSEYVMHYDGCGTVGWRACQAVSTDLTTWQKTGPILELGPPGSIDAGCACSPWIVENGGTWFMYYLTAETQTPPPDLIPIFPYRTRLATAASPFGPWTKQPAVIPFDLVPGTYYARNVSPGFVLPHDGEFLHYFSYASESAPGSPGLGALALARTNDPAGAWTVDATPLLPGAERIENSSLYFEPANGLWFLFTNHIAITDAGFEYTDAVWVYWSTDPTVFDPEKKAIVIDATTSSWAKSVIGMPAVVPIGDRLAVFYDGTIHGDFGHMRRDIGLAFLDLPLKPPDSP